ncbi:hypothetical protein AXK58_13995 [Tsukamurella tyrosinosolvens]|nr:hypothetical protein AXK58_13995 [Tsukamurella tyrosinosolvens]
MQARTEAISAYREHYRRTGSSTIPRALVCPNGFRLGAWAAGRRAAYRRGQLSDRVIGELERLPGWTWGEPQTRRRKEPPASSDTVREEVTLRNGTTVRAAPQVLFATGLRHLDEFVTERRHGAVPREYVCGDRFPLGAWIATVRTAHNRAELPPEQVVQLEERPNWHWDTAP